MGEKFYHLTEAATKIGIAPITLKRWLLEGKVPDVKRDRRGWRIFTQEDINRIKKYSEKTTPPPEQLTLPGKGFSINNNKSSFFRDSASNGNKTLPFHRWAPWIAGFSANFVEDCFKSYLDPEKKHSDITILDPFAGVGTTLMEGMLHGYNATGFEINPYAYLACKVKLNSHKFSTKKLEKELDKFLKYYEKREQDEKYAPRSKPPKRFGTRIPFYSSKVERKVLIFFDFLQNIKDLDVRDFFRLAFGTVMVSFSNYSYEPSLGRRASSGKADIADAPVEQVIAEKIKTMIGDMKEFEELHAENAKNIRAEILNESFFKALDFCKPGSVDLLVTSPPYLNNYHYMRNTRPQLHWLSLVKDREDSRKIEHESFGKFWQTVRDQAPIELTFKLPVLEKRLDLLRSINPDRRTYGGPGWANYATTYFNDSFRFCKILKKILKPKGTAVVVIGNSILQGVEIKTDEIFSDIGELTDLKKKDIILLRTKRTGSSIVDSTVRAAKTKKKTILYETAVIMER